MSDKRISSHLEGSILGSAVKNLHKQYLAIRNSPDLLKDKETQTLYRENECQTLPWEPPYNIREGHNPEVLTLINFTWGHGLPAGMHELEIINRMRMKRAWEQILPPMDSVANIKARLTIISALEADEWAFREAEIQFIMDLRMKLAEEVMEAREEEKREKVQERVLRLNEFLSKKKHREIKKIRNRLSRELRKLSKRHQANQTRGKEKNILSDFGPVEDDFMYCYRKPRNVCTRKFNPFDDDELKLDMIVKKRLKKMWPISKKEPHYAKARYSPSTQICPKLMAEAERTVLQLCRDIESIRTYIELTETRTLLKRKIKVPSLPPTPCRSPREDSCANPEEVVAEGEAELAADLLRKLVRGRGIQCHILEGRERYRGLIEELQSDRAMERHLRDSGEKSPEELRREEERRKTLQESRANEILEALEGKTISKMLTFLTEELKRLQDEKRAHALALLAERERLKKRIEQSSKEQRELNRRRELDEMYRHILKVNQESVETYLEDIVKDGIEWVSQKEATKYIVDLADKIDAIAKDVEQNEEKIDEEGMVSDMVYNFVLPEVEKESARKRLHERQQSYLCAAHAAIYDEISNMPADELLSDRASTHRTDLLDLKSASFDLENEESHRETKGSSNDDDFDEVQDRDSFASIIELILSYADMSNGDDYMIILTPSHSEL
ncbi:hypothetical protein QAD02_015055 [Eretmocerus hayati]|uniref:Uncharacterized protein n=1 Tax=Eretmocerus hayati TaxID=131215 RepID=A0ACC2P796_9HYME|nr:hypothetical protein QAD02_015055 [Eretmocerus hayati]